MRKKFPCIAIIFALVSGIATDALSQWVPTNGPYGGVAEAVAIIGKTVFAGLELAYNEESHQGGFYTSNDNGKNWSLLTSYPNIFYRPHSLVVKDTELYSVGEYNIYHSFDLGKSWDTIGNGGARDFVVSGKDLYKTDDAGVYHSADNGANWTLIGFENTGHPHPNPINKLGLNGGYLFAAGYYSGIYRTSDQGVKWVAVDSGLTSDTTTCFAFRDSIVLIGTYSGVFRTTLNGTKWTAMNTSLTNLQVNTLVYVGSDLYAGTNDGIFLSTDNGMNWSQISIGLNNRFVLSFAANGSDLFAGTNGGAVYYSNNRGKNWTDESSSIKIKLDVFRFAEIGKYIFAATYDGGVFRSTDDGTTWMPMNIGLPGLNAGSIAVNGDNLYVVTFNNNYQNNITEGKLSLSTDYGSSWTTITNGFRDTSIDNKDTVIYLSYATCAALAGTKVYVGTDDGSIFITDNNGKTWKPDYIDPKQKGRFYWSKVNDITVFGDNIIVSEAGQSSLFISNENDTAWNGLYSLLASRTTFYNLYVNGTNLYGECDSGFVVSLDTGQSWKVINGGINAFVANTTNLFVGTYSDSTYPGGVFISRDNGNNWAAINTGLETVAGNPTAINALCTHDSLLFAGNHDHGVWIRHLSDFNNSGVKKTNPSSEIQLSPNPTNGILSIRNSPDNLTGISILNVLGQSVMEMTAPNAPEFTLDLSKLPPGIYFARFSLANEVVTRKIAKN